MTVMEKEKKTPSGRGHVKDSALRLRHYKEGLDPGVVMIKLEAKKETMTEEALKWLSEISQVEKAVKEILCNNGVQTMEFAGYYAFARQVTSRARRFYGETLAREVQGFIRTWFNRGLHPGILGEISQTIISYYGGPEISIPSEKDLSQVSHTETRRRKEKVEAKVKTEA